MSQSYPFSAIVDQPEMKQALLIAAVDRGIGGVLVFGERGTGKSTAVRALARVLPEDEDTADGGVVPVVDMPLGVTEDRLVGALDIEKALTSGEKSFQPGLLAKADGGFLYIDEINLLEDYLVDLLLDVAASGENIVEREGLSVRHSAKFVLVGSGNPEEGELRPQLLDRFALSVDTKTPDSIETRVEIVRRRDRFDRDPDAFVEEWTADEQALTSRIARARSELAAIETPDSALTAAARLCASLGTDGLRGELTLIRAARAVAALDGETMLTAHHIGRVAPAVLRHRLRRDPLDETGSNARIERALAELDLS
ncbi:ATP-binding protein [Pararhizobium mangrovi]|uniref:Magnesium chelatase ATPase subunit I n=1 Tax=Pararhizobium mangrovi TaxID=2590452 RepID=A0A506U801_9HYPH|nr:ATP-binding protein [Pararhizobium mangrovi]TPW29608.1 magnesium chelatase ATPase subunit I [Pararhizobium mangrovi]